MLVTLTNGLQINCSKLEFHTDTMLILKFRGIEDIWGMPRIEEEFLIRPIITNDKDCVRDASLYLHLETDRIASITSNDSCSSEDGDDDGN